MKTYLWDVSLIVFFGIFGVVFEPLMWCAQFLWDWFIHDAVIAVSNIKISAYASSSKLSTLFLGLLLGTVTVFSIRIYRWIFD